MDLAELTFNLERLLSGFSVSAAAFDDQNHKVLATGLWLGEQFPPLSDGISEAIRNLAVGDVPRILWVREELCAAVLHVEEDCWLVLGPVDVRPTPLSERLAPPLALNGFLSLVCLCARSLLDIHCTESDLMQLNAEGGGPRIQDWLDYRLSEDIPDRVEYTLQMEQDWLDSIRNGEPLPLSLTRESDGMRYVGRMSKDDDYKQAEYAAVASVTLAARAAMQAGVPPQVCYETSDLLLQRLSVCHSGQEALEISLTASNTFSSLVRDRKAELGTGPLCRQVQQYVTAHLLEKISVTEMAAELGVSRSHLSKTFSTEMGLSLKDYILREKMDAAQNLLLHSDQTVGEIAEYLSFSSASRFSEQFRERFGQSPGEFRSRPNQRKS